MPAIARGLERSDREPGAFEIVPEVIVAMGDTADEQAAAAVGVRRLLSFYGSTPAYRPVLEVEGWDALQPELNALSKQGQWAAMADRIDDDMLVTLAVAGSPESCAHDVVERFGAHAGRVCCYFPGYPVTEAQISAFVAAVRAAS